MLDPVGSTSWHGRHLAAFRKLDELLRAAEVEHPEVMIVGPGGVTRWAAPFLNNADTVNVGVCRKLIGDLARYSDQVLRRIPGLSLRSLEPLELTRALSGPHTLLIVDRSRRVLAAVARDLPHAVRLCVDISYQPVPQQTDVVVAFNVVCRLENNAATGMKHIVGAVRDGGWLLIDDRSAEAHLPKREGFLRVGPKIYRRSLNGPALKESH